MTVQAIDSDTETLHRLGYAQELLRRMGGFSNFAVSFTIISILSGCLTAYGVAMFNGGPIDMNIGWPLVGIMVIIVGLAMAEVCSSYPTAGGLYYWSAKLGGKNGAAWSWFTGWFNLVGQVAVTAGIDGGLASVRVSVHEQLVRLSARPAAHPPGLRDRALPARTAEHLRRPSRRAAQRHLGLVAYHRCGGDRRGAADRSHRIISRSRSSSRASTTATGASFPGSVIYVFLIGLLLAQYTFTGYDASAHMTEETKNAATAGPRGIVLSIVVSLVAGWILLIGVTSAIQNYGAESTAVVPAAQIFIDAAGKGLGQFLLLIAIGAQFYCGMSSVTANSRMIYAFSRDGAVPGHQLWSKINKRTRTPTNSIWLAVVGAFILFAALPLQRLRIRRGHLHRGHRSLHRLRHPDPPPAARRDPTSSPARGAWGSGADPIGIIAVTWIVIISILFILPTAFPITGTNFNYTIVAFAVVLGGTTIWWFASAKNWFKGPKVQGTAEELASIEATFVGGAAPTPAVSAG